MMNYVDEASQDVLAASFVQNDSARYLSTAVDPNLPVGTILLEKDNPDSPRLQVSSASTSSSDGSWLTPVELLVQEYCVKYSFITFTHSTIAGSMFQKAATREEAINLVRAWLVRIYQPVEFDSVTV